MFKKMLTSKTNIKFIWKSIYHEIVGLKDNLKINTYYKIW